MEGSQDEAIRGLQLAVSELRERTSGLPIRTLGFLVVLLLSQWGAFFSFGGMGFSRDTAMLYILMTMSFLVVAVATRVKLEELRLLGILSFALVGLFSSWACTLALYGFALGVDFAQVPAGALGGTILMQSLFVAPSEELIFRYALPQALLSKFKASFAWLALLIPQLSFGLYHYAAYQGGWVSISIAIIFGCLMMAAYYVPIPERWGLGPRVGLGFCIGAHAAYNLVLLGVLAPNGIVLGG